MSALQLAQLDATGRTVTAIVFGLLVVAAALALLTAWYWRVTDPRRASSPIDPRPPRQPPGGSMPAIDDPAPNGATVRVDPGIPGSGPMSDDTAVLDRQMIMQERGSASTDGPTEPSAKKRAPSDGAAAASSGPVATEQPDSTEAPAVEELQDELVIDLRADPQTAPPDAGRKGAGDDGGGLSFEEWLALAEEDS